MSWLARTIANSLRLEEDVEEEDHAHHTNSDGDPNKPESETVQTDSQSPSSTPTARGVKEDLSELTKSISRQFWGVASFLAPPPDPSHNQSVEQPDDDDEDLIAGIRSDFAEIGGRFKSGISKLSGNKTVSEFTKIASTFLQLGSEEYCDLSGVVGVTEEVVAFATNLAMHPETWLDFPLPDDPDSDDFDLSDAQQEHALAVERLAPSLAALRMELCPGSMSDGYFWKIYFVLLHPRLQKSDADLLSTPEIIEARAMLTQALDKRSMEKKEPDLSVRSHDPAKEEEHHLFVPRSASLESAPLQDFAVEAVPVVDVFDVEVEKHLVQSTVTQVIDKSVIKESKFDETNRFLEETYADDADDWLKEDSSEMVGASETSIPAGNDEDVSFSDLEEEDDEVPASYKKTRSGSDSNDWLNVDDIDAL